MIAENNSLIAVGKVKNEGGSFSVKIPSTVESVNELNDFPIFSYKNKVIKLKDIAVIKKTYKDPEYIARVNGTSAIVLEVTKRTGANIISTISQVKEVVKNQQKYLPNNLKIIYSQDQSENIKSMVDDLENGNSISCYFSNYCSYIFSWWKISIINSTLNSIIFFNWYISIGNIWSYT